MRSALHSFIEFKAAEKTTWITRPKRGISFGYNYTHRPPHTWKKEPFWSFLLPFKIISHIFTAAVAHARTSPKGFLLFFSNITRKDFFLAIFPLSSAFWHVQCVHTMPVSPPNIFHWKYFVSIFRGFFSVQSIRKEKKNNNPLILITTMMMMKPFGRSSLHFNILFCVVLWQCVARIHLVSK